jgi:Arc/MetJ family transcription regulator
MRTTINLDDDVVPTVKKYAESRSISVGKAVSELVRKGIHASLPTRVVNGIHVTDLPADSP